MVREVVVVGAGGHARVCLELLAGDASLVVVGCLSSDGRASVPLGAPVVGTDAELAAHVGAGRAVFVAVGDNRARLRVLEQALELGAELVTARSDHAVVSPSAVVGRGVALMAGAVVNAGTVLGDGVIVNTNASVDHDGVLGRCVHVAPGSAVAGGVEVGEGTLLGIGCSVVPGARIGAWATVGAGAAVVGDLAAGVVAVGVPARPWAVR